MVWFIVLNILMNDGAMYTKIHVANDPTYNNEQSCNEAGKILVDQAQLEIGTNSGKTFFTCLALTAEEIRAATGKRGSNS
jgi:hypothetical protein